MEQRRKGDATNIENKKRRAKRKQTKQVTDERITERTKRRNN